MARYVGPVCRLCRREGEKLFLKGERCYTPKCAIERREGGPGQHGKGRQRFSEFKIQLREKQKVKRIYGLLERQFRRYAEWAARSKGVTGTELLLNLERRLDNMVYRLGFAHSRSHARQVVRHGHVLVNGSKVNIPSYQVQVGDSIQLTEHGRTTGGVQGALEASKARTIPEWLSVEKDVLKGTVQAMPTRDQLTHPIKEQLIVELYSR